MLGARDGFLVVGEIFANSFVAGLHGRSMIDESSNLDALGQLRYATDMIAMVVSDDDIVDFLDLGVLHGGQDAVGIAPAEPSPAGVYQHGLARRRHDQRGLPALDVDEINLEGFSARGAGERQQEEEAKEHLTRIVPRLPGTFRRLRT